VHSECKNYYSLCEVLSNLVLAPASQTTTCVPRRLRPSHGRRSSAAARAVKARRAGKATAAFQFSHQTTSARNAVYRVRPLEPTRRVRPPGEVGPRVKTQVSSYPCLVYRRVRVPQEHQQERRKPPSRVTIRRPLRSLCSLPMATAATTPPSKMRALQYEAYAEGAAGLKVINASRSAAVLYAGGVRNWGWGPACFELWSARLVMFSPEALRWYGRLAGP
jgi:hypothetical protein